MNKTRRIDIDFLRAVSVLSVIIFHLNKDLFPLGYLGVDIFFIISGYLISKIIIKEINDKKFTFYNFYLRRAKRILPVLLIVLVVIFILSSFVLLLSDLKYLSKSLLSSLGFFSNIYFWITGGYFGTNDELKPLLHLWSLSIEGQFYIFFPFIFYLILKIEKYKYFKFIIVLSISAISFFLSLYIIKKGHYELSFFLLPFRIWEFGLGTFVALLPKIQIKNNFYKFFAISFAFVIIILNFYKLPDNLPPATLVVLGSGIIIYLGIEKKDFFYKFINFRLLIFTGLISFSLYLWHWPIISLFKYVTIEELNFFQLLFCFILTYIISIFSWKYIELYFLIKANLNTLFRYIFFNIFILIFFCILILFNQNFPSRYNKLSNSIADAVGTWYHCSFLEYRKFGDTYACKINLKNKENPKIVLYGNSHAHMYGWGLKEALKQKKISGLTIPLNSCLPTIDINISTKCLEKVNNYYKAIINDDQIKIVLIGLTWGTLNLIDKDKVNYFDETKRNKSLLELIQNLENNNKKVYLIGPIETPGSDIASLVSREIAFKGKSNISFFTPKSSFEDKYSHSIMFFENQLKDNFLQPHKILCDDINCFFIDENGSNFSDGSHLSIYGSMKMREMFLKIIK